MKSGFLWSKNLRLIKPIFICFTKLLNEERLLLNRKERLNEGLDLYDLKQEAHLPYSLPEK